MIEHNMEYNSQKELLEIPEYGRNVQMLIQHAKTIEDPAYRQAFVEEVVNLMHQMHPQNRNIDDYREKLWKHVFRIAKYDLDVTPPGEEQPTPEDIYKRPDAVPYPSGAARYRHYGYNVQRLVRKGIEMEEGPIRQGFVKAIASYMKLAYRTWNKEHYISDDIIKNDLKSLSDGALTLDDDVSLDNLSHHSGGGHSHRRNQQGGKKRQGGKNNHRNNKNNHHKRRKK